MAAMRPRLAAEPVASKPVAPKPGLDAGTERRIRERIGTSSRQLVAAALVSPILEEFRNSIGEGGMFGKSVAEKRLAPAIDPHIAESIVRRSDFAITRQVERSMLQRVGLKPFADGQASSMPQRPTIEVIA